MKTITIYKFTPWGSKRPVIAGYYRGSLVIDPLTVHPQDLDKMLKHAKNLGFTHVVYLGLLGFKAKSGPIEDQDPIEALTPVEMERREQ